MTDTAAQVGDVGTKFLVTILEDDDAGNPQAVDVSGATLKTVTLKPPSGAVITRNASFETDGTDGKIFILSQSGDLSVAGAWEVQGRVTLAAGDWRSEVGSFAVKANLA